MEEHTVVKGGGRGITTKVDEACEDEVFQRTLAAKLWTDNSFNTRAFTNTIIGAWKLKNLVEVQELSKNLFLFRFATKRDLEGVLQNDHGASIVICWSLSECLERSNRRS